MNFHGHRSQLNFLSLRDATTFNCVYVRKSETRLETATSGNDLRHWPRSFHLCSKAELICATHHFSKTAFLLSFFSHITNFALAPLMKTTLCNLKVSLLRKNMWKIGFFTLVTVACFSLSFFSVLLHRERSCFMDTLKTLASLNIYSRLFI